jgi:hypothetical protein
MNNNDLIERVRNLVHNAGCAAKENAAYSGSMNDGGGGGLMDQAKFYQYGRLGIMPREWESYIPRAEAQADPEYETYQRLRTKFAGK